MMFTVLLALSAVVAPALGLDNGLARTPPMGWLTWERFRCNIDCDNDPDNCIGEKLMMDMADHMSADGFLKAGYEYIIVDDCWLAKDRAADGQLQPDAKRFPNGMKALADYIHAKGLKFGIYEDFGTHTCAGYPGSEYYMQMDAQTFADWGVDYLKLDGCYANVDQYDDGYPTMTGFLNRTGRPIVFSCSWPAYQEGKMQPNYPAVAKACNMARNHDDIADSWSSVSSAIEYYGEDTGNFSEVAAPGYFNDPDMPKYDKIAENCNLWRNYGDISDSWDAVASIINFYGDDKTGFVEVAGPGNFNDPDMLILGNFGLSYEQERVQMGMWAMMASPLIMSVDLRTIRQSSKDLLLNPYVLALNQDKLGKQGKRISKSGNIQVWTKPLADQSVAFAFLNGGTNGMPSKVSMKFSDMGLNNTNGYNVTEVFDNTYVGKFRPQDTFTMPVNPTGIFLANAKPL